MLTQSELIQTIAVQSNIDRDIVNTVFEKFKEITYQSILKGEDVRLSKFGTFSLIKRHPTNQFKVRCKGKVVASPCYMANFRSSPILNNMTNEYFFKKNRK